MSNRVSLVHVDFAWYFPPRDWYVSLSGSSCMHNLRNINIAYLSFLIFLIICILVFPSYHCTFANLRIVPVRFLISCLLLYSLWFFHSHVIFLLL